MTYININTFILLIIFASTSYGECINEINSEKDLVISNLCIYENTILGKVKSVELLNKLNIDTWIKPHRIYKLSVEIQKSFKGINSGLVCLVQRREESTFNFSYNLNDEIYIISYNNNKQCSVIETGSIIKATNSLIETIELEIANHR